MGLKQFGGCQQIFTMQNAVKKKKQKTICNWKIKGKNYNTIEWIKTFCPTLKPSGC